MTYEKAKDGKEQFAIAYRRTKYVVSSTANFFIKGYPSPYKKN